MWPAQAGMELQMAVITVGLGFVLLLAGRPLYAVFTGVMAFLVGQYICERFAITPAGWNDFVLPLIFAGIGAALAFVLRRWSARVASVVAAIYVVLNMPNALGASVTWNTSPVIMGVVSVLFVVLLILWFDYALIFISSLTGTTMILDQMFSGALGPTVMFIILTIFGILVQFLLLNYGKSLPD
jgi:hypothetical protein